MEQNNLFFEVGLSDDLMDNIKAFCLFQKEVKDDKRGETFFTTHPSKIK